MNTVWKAIVFITFVADGSLGQETVNCASKLTGMFTNVIVQGNNCIVDKSSVLGFVKLENGNDFVI
jgi:hypothetical protein